MLLQNEKWPQLEEIMRNWYLRRSLSDKASQHPSGSRRELVTSPTTTWKVWIRWIVSFRNGTNQLMGKRAQEVGCNHKIVPECLLHEFCQGEVGEFLDYTVPTSRTVQWCEACFFWWFDVISDQWYLSPFGEYVGSFLQNILKQQIQARCSRVLHPQSSVTIGPKSWFASPRTLATCRTPATSLETQLQLMGGVQSIKHLGIKTIVRYLEQLWPSTGLPDVQPSTLWPNYGDHLK